MNMSTNDEKVADKVALVTGASRGLGAAIATALAKAGYRVAATATTEAGVANIKANLSDYGDGHDAFVLDVKSTEVITDLMDTLKKEMASPLILVNNAGVTSDQLLMRMSDQDWDKVLDTNLKGCWRMAKACIRPMLRQGWGRIINISSIVAVMGNPGQVNYAAAKAGLQGLTRALAREVAAKGVTVNCLAPGFIDTDMTRGLTEQQRESLLANIPVGRMGYPHEVAAAVEYLASDAAGFITGETIHINGGMYST